MEIWYSNQWNTVCDDSWSISDARVVCRQLGYSSGVSARCCASFGQGTGSILLDDLKCTGSEGSLLSCPHSGLNVHNCGHGEDAGVICKLTCSFEIVNHLKAYSQTCCTCGNES